MRWSVLGAIGLAMMIVLSSCSSPTPAFKGGPRLQVEPGEIDFGILAADASTTIKQVTLKNVGDAPLLIEKVQSRVVEGCCPPVLELNQVTIPPGKKETLSIPLKMSSDMTGPHRFEVLIYSNDALTPQATLVIRGEFVPR